MNPPMAQFSNDSKALVDRLVALTRDLILIASDVTRPDEIDRSIEFIKNQLEGIDQTVIREYRKDGSPSLTVFPANIQEPEVILIGHLDVISHAKKQDYRSRVENDRIIGPGAGDMKGAIAILLDLFKTAHRSHPGISLGLIITTDEESGGRAGIRYLFEDQGIRCGAAIIPDGGSINKFSVEEKGFLHIRVFCEGKSAHSARPWLGNNPLEKLMDGLKRIRDYFDPLRKPNTHWFPTCAVTILKTPNKTVNRVPKEAEASLDVRFPPNYTVLDLTKKIEALLGSDFQIHVKISANPSKLNPDPLFLEAAKEILEETPTLIKEDGASDARFVSCYNIPVVVSRPRVGNLHSLSEWIDIPSMEQYYRITEKYIWKKLLL